MQGAQDSIRPDSRSAILTAALAEFAADPSASLGHIASRAGVGRATLHRHFQSRDELIRELALQSIREIDAACEGLEDQATSAIDYLRLVVEAVIPLGNRFNFLTHESWTNVDATLRAEVDRQAAALGDVVEACKAEGSIDPATATVWVVSTIDALIYAAWSLIASGHIAPRDAASLLMRTLQQGLQP